MSHISVKEALEKIFKGSEKPSDVIKQIRNEDVADLELVLRKMCGKVYKKELEKAGPEVVDFAKNGQWTISKATKPGPTLNYGKIAPEQNPMSNPAAAKEAKAARYADIDAKAGVLDYNKNPATAPKYTGAVERAAQVKAKLDAESKETALETMARRGQIKPLTPTNKSDGINVEEEPTSAERSKMTAKNEMMGYGSETAPMMMSEKEPHADDPKHEEKEKKKAKKIKDKAQELLDMHD